MSCKKIGIIGGSYDPIHNGHLQSAEFVYRELGLDKVIFIPAYIAPHKVGMEYASAVHRYKMTELAVRDYPYFTVSDIELRRSGISYTYDTIMQLKKEHPDSEIYFIVGADSVPQFNTWHRIYELLEEVTFAAVARPGYSEAFNEAIEEYGELGKKKIMLLNMPEIAVSSTEIRERVKAGLSIDGMLPDGVKEYILANGLYRS